MQGIRSCGISLTLLLSLGGCSALPGSYEARLADYLSETGAKMYGAYWCPHCAEQKDYFGGAAEELPYVECDPLGRNAQPELCAQMGIDVYPTWVIEGEYYFGSQRPGKLAVLSGFELPPEYLPDVEPSDQGGYSSAE